MQIIVEGKTEYVLCICYNINQHGSPTPSCLVTHLFPWSALRSIQHFADCWAHQSSNYDNYT